jgi:type III secretion protein R
MELTTTLFNPTALFLIGAVTLVIPLFTIVATSFVRFVIVLHLLRQAIGAQSVPPSFVLNVLAAALTLIVMTSPMVETFDIASTINTKDLTYARGLSVAGDLAGPLLKFMKINTGDVERSFMEDVRIQRWSPAAQKKFGPDSVFVTMPGFVLSEVRRGFELGFLIYIPFVIIDVMIATLTTAMGMSSVSPNIIALPLKLLFFVYLNGWTKVAYTLLSGYT